MELVLDFGPVNEKNIGQFKEINKQTLAVKYSPQFYTAVLQQWNKLTWLCYVNDIPIGSISARFQERNGELAVYVMTCSVLKPYRRRGIAARMMQHLIGAIREEGQVSLLFLNVWTVSEDAIAFYKSLGFEEVETLQDYYKELEPASALVLEHRLS